MLDEVYQTSQALLNKDQLGYLKPMWFNLFANVAQRRIYNTYFTDLKSNVRKMNWMLDGKDFANMSEHSQQLLEYFSKIALVLSPDYNLPTDLEFVEDVFLVTSNKRVEKLHYSDFKDLQRNIYASPNDCTPQCSKVGGKLVVSTLTTSNKNVNLHYLRKPLTPKWTYEEVDGVPFFNPTATDYQDFDLPSTSFDKLVELVVEMGGIALRDGNVVQAINQNQAEEFQQNRQE